MCYMTIMRLFLKGSLLSNKIAFTALVGLLILVLTPISPQCFALTANLYETAVPAAQIGQSQSELTQEAFKNVLVQISGSEKILTQPPIKKAMSAADSYVSRFSYKEDADKKRFFQVRFDETLVNELLRRNNAPILTQQRPSTTVWMVIDREHDNPHWVSNDSETAIFQQMNADAKQRALPLMFPLLDLADTSFVSEKAVWNEDFTALQSASKRYNSEALWIGKISKQPSGWHGQWTLIFNGAAQTWDTTNENLEQLCRDAMDELAARFGRNAAPDKGGDEQYSSEYSPEADNSDAIFLQPPAGPKKPLSRFRLSVQGIKGAEQYAKLQEYLRSLPGVKDIEVLAVNPNQTIIDIASNSDRQTLVQAISTGQLLLNNVSSITTDSEAVEPMEDDGMLNYKMSEVL